MKKTTLFLVLAALVAGIAFQSCLNARANDNELEVAAGVFTISIPLGGEDRFVKFTDGNVSCYAPVTRAGISCVKN